MAKTKTTFVCQSCGAVSMRWAGRCEDCGEWNSIVEEQVIESGTHVRPSIAEGASPSPLRIDRSRLRSVSRLEFSNATGCWGVASFRVR